VRPGVSLIGDKSALAVGGMPFHAQAARNRKAGVFEEVKPHQLTAEGGEPLEPLQTAREGNPREPFAELLAESRKEPGVVENSVDVAEDLLGWRDLS
jgi:hypothetical protein